MAVEAVLLEAVTTFKKKQLFNLYLEISAQLN